jgi:hypothetical protein
VPSASEPATSARSEPTRETLAKIAARHEELARLLDPEKYGPAWGLGAQAEYLAPSAGVSAVVLGYDAVFMEVDATLGVGIGGDPVNNTAAVGTYSFDARVAFPVHRGVRADFSIIAGGGATLVDPPTGRWYALGLALGGGRIRMFVSPNVALTATLGVAAIFRGEHSLFVLGAKPWERPPLCTTSADSLPTCAAAQMPRAYSRTLMARPTMRTRVTRDSIA